ncbi:rRNA maturation RNase YbeY [Botrimarina mediterranea]|uniref:Endoribonuclease YbeY n=1 Tax=Botrimarina mediterranea TaxID=2528022 RepID=A0A518K2J1_9BACT|nr:rRNA maturation RNase YbeY [Botrimarina mediterranea]QDV72023.1 Endoribonuclease YbeY [Botrimarina mediterranea]QDV76564.1 Endoribonuclease YbeY [Planctomycetes bacterium K2D]CAE7440575.1 ybeY [Symbiodinium sp. CCMP2456]
MNIEIANQQSTLSIDEDRIRRVAAAILADAGYGEGELSVAVVDDPTIHELNVRHLQHDYPTDVLSFALLDEPPRLEGEVIVSADTAVENAAEYGWPAEDELLLYVIHGTLHLAGHRDKADDEVAAMRAAERRYLRLADVEPPALAPSELAAEGTQPQ